MDTSNQRFPYSPDEFKRGEQLQKTGCVGPLFFSDATYQVEITDPEFNEPCWPLIQIDDTGRLLDSFCNCHDAEKSKTCAHLAAAYCQIFAGHSLPLHIRFKESLWHQLGQLAALRHGSDPHLLRKTKEGWEALSATGKRLFFIHAHHPQSHRYLHDLFNRQADTESISLKLANLSPEELLLWKEGRPSPQLTYELSFWSDLAKWWMQLQDHKPYQLSFSEEPLPHWIYCTTSPFSFGLYIAEANWPLLIPSLSTVDSPLPVLQGTQQHIQSMAYDSQRRCFVLDVLQPSVPTTPSLPADHIRLGEWILIPHQGFFPAKPDPLFSEKEIPASKINRLMQQHATLVKQHLKNTSVHLLPIKPSYHLYFDDHRHLHVKAYVFEQGDLQQSDSCVFGSWVFLDKKGFYELTDLLFDTADKVIDPTHMEEFINNHRIWLHGFEGFQTHISSIESNLNFSVSKTDGLTFSSQLSLSNGEADLTDFGAWIYLKGKGFFLKREENKQLNGTIPYSEINTFISLHRHELESVPGFFASQCPLDRAGLEIFLNEANQIVVRPYFQFFPNYSLHSVFLFNEYTYVPGEGFAEIPYEKRLPPNYLEEKVIAPADESYFIAYELHSLEPHILSLQKTLQQADQLFIHIDRMRPSRVTDAKEWLLELSYVTELGSIDLYPVWQAIQANKKYLFTPAGLILLKQTRFNWLKQIPKKRWLKQGKVLRLTTMDWLRLSVFDDLRAPNASDETRQYIESLSTLNANLPIDFTALKSSLRAYQELGVKWLWFLYHHSLSGLLCDEMGLGKTHQAMGLIAAIHHLKPSHHTLIVCPTSVIYHWEDLIHKFLPDLKLFIFYGISRKLEAFSASHHILLTSYGTLRSEKQALSKIDFDLAIFDEVQIAKNTHSQTHKAIKLIKAAMRLGLTGTPIENRLLELKALFDVVIPGYMPIESQFKEWFVNPIERNHDPEKKQLLANLVRPFILRRKKTEVLLELPEKIEEIAYCDLSAEQAELYRQTYMRQKEALLHNLENEAQPVPYLHVFALITTLKQICNHPCLITKQFEHFQKHASGKWELFITLLQQARDSGQKLVVFSQYLDMLTLIERYLTENQIGFSAIRGSTRDRKAELEAFRNDPAKEVFVASLQAVGVGVDLVSASVVIHYDRWWNPARENQATDRVHRIGQNRGVQVFKLVTKGTIEEHIHQLIERKKSLTEGILGFDEQDQVKSFNRQELIELLRMIEQEPLFQPN